MFLGENIHISEYWRRVREIQRGLPDVVALVSTPDTRISESERGRVAFCEADSLTAAKCLYARSHRIAEPDEIVVQEKRREANVLEAVRQHLAKQGIVQITMPEPTSSE